MLARLCRYAAALAVIGIPATAVAQVVPPSLQPGREREQFATPQAPRAQPRGAVIALPSTVAPAGAATVKLVIRDISITGSTVYSQEMIGTLYADLIGHEVPLQAVYDLAQRITAKYGQDGYVLSRAIVPPQNLNAGGAVVHIQVIEGYIDRVVWPAKLNRYRNFFTYYEARIVADRPANIRTLERYLLLLGDLPGFKVSTKLEPSKTELAASTLVVEVTEKPLDVFGRVDNHGSRGQGPGEFFSSATLNNILGAHEAFTATYAGSVQLRELQYVGATYRQVLTGEGLTAFIDGSYSWGRPGTRELELLDYKTRALYADAGLAYPLIRSRERNLTLTALGFVSEPVGIIFDDPGTPPSTRDRLRGARLRADSDWADPLRGINQFFAQFSQGIQGLGSTDNDNPLASRGNGRVDFSKLEFSYSRLQPLFWNLSTFVSAYTQYAFTPLLSPELCVYGGRFYGRAFDFNAMVADKCWEVVGELRVDMPMPAGLFSLAQLYGFADHGRLTNIHPEFLTPKEQEGSSLGAGIRFGWQNQFNTDFYVAKAIEGPRDDTRVFFVVTARN